MPLRKTNKTPSKINQFLYGCESSCRSRRKPWFAVLKEGASRRPWRSSLCVSGLKLNCCSGLFSEEEWIDVQGWKSTQVELWIQDSYRLGKEWACQGEKCGHVVQAHKSWFSQVLELIWVGTDSLAEKHLEGQSTATAGQDCFCLPCILGIYILVSLNFLMSSSTDIFAWGRELRTWECFALLSLASVCREFPGLSARMFLRGRALEAWHNHGNVLLSAFWDSRMSSRSSACVS